MFNMLALLVGITGVACERAVDSRPIAQAPDSPVCESRSKTPRFCYFDKVQIVVPFLLWRTPHIKGKLNTTVIGVVAMLWHWYKYRSASYKFAKHFLPSIRKKTNCSSYLTSNRTFDIISA